MTTALTLVTDALKLIGVAGQGEDLENEEANDGLRLLNQMLAVWSIEGITIPYETITSITLTGASSYTIAATGADVTLARPSEITAAQIIIGTDSYPLERLNGHEWARVDIGTGQPCKYWYHDTSPLGTLYLDTSGYSGTLRIFSEQPIGTLALDDSISLPVEYELPITYSLAVLSAPFYEKEVPSLVASIAAASKDAITTHNLDIPEAQLDPSVLRNQVGRFNIDSGYY